MHIHVWLNKFGHEMADGDIRDNIRVTYSPPKEQYFGYFGQVKRGGNLLKESLLPYAHVLIK